VRRKSRGQGVPAGALGKAWPVPAEDADYFSQKMARIVNTNLLKDNEDGKLLFRKFETK
jgi:hypothetical protein